MPLVIHCPKCSKRYQVADNVAGKQVRCQQCQTAFTATAPLAAAGPLAPQNPLGAPDPLAGVDLSRLPTAPSPLGQSNPLGAPAAGSASSFYTPAANRMAGGISNPSCGPTDAVMRMVSGGMLAAGIIMLLITVGTLAADGSVYVALVALAPLAILLGIAG